MIYLKSVLIRAKQYLPTASGASRERFGIFWSIPRKFPSSV